MNIFSEIYGTYFRIAAEALLRESVTDKEVRDIIADEGFADSMLFVPDKLIPDKSGNSPWGLLKRNEDGTLSSVLRKSPPKLLTLLQKRWLKALLSDRKFRLFLTDEDCEKLSERLCDIKPLYDTRLFRFFDMYADGDDYESEDYRRFFRQILLAIKTKELVDITFISPKNGEKRGVYLPLRLEYSTKNDKFRILCVMFKDDRPISRSTINVGRITAVKSTGRIRKRKVDMSKYHEKTRCETPVTVVVNSERNGIERFMTEFASYEKQSVFDMEAGKCTVQIWYDKQDETELLIQLLGFGPVLEILSPKDFRQEAARRVERQYSLLFGEDEQNP